MDLPTKERRDKDGTRSNSQRKDSSIRSRGSQRRPKATKGHGIIRNTLWKCTEEELINFLINFWDMDERYLDKYDKELDGLIEYFEQEEAIKE